MQVSQKRRRDEALENMYMRRALDVAKQALAVGEVPVGCVIVLRQGDDNDSVIVSHGANQVNATRDATRHAEIVAIDRMLTGGLASDQVCLPAKDTRKSHNVDHDPRLRKPEDHHRLINVPDQESHWKNKYGWGSGRVFTPDIFKMCDLYVTCEPCVMCAAALARVGIARVFFGCSNDRFGGCGSLLSLHEEDAIPSSLHKGYPIFSGIMADEAVALLRTFYDRENFHAPDNKRKRKVAADESMSS